MAVAKEIDPTFGLRLRELRKLADLTQTELGELVGIRQGAIARLENAGREPGWGTVKKLAAALSVTPDAFLERPGE